MSLVIYHNYPKKLYEVKFDKEMSYEFLISTAKRCIKQGLQDGRDFKKQRDIYLAFVKNIQSRKLYKLNEGDKNYYTICILSLWQLRYWSPDDEKSPFWFSPIRKKRRH